MPLKIKAMLVMDQERRLPLLDARTPAAALPPAWGSKPRRSCVPRLPAKLAAVRNV